MTETQWNIFISFRNRFKQQCEKWSEFASILEPLQKEAYQKDTPQYPIENPVVYNTDLDRVTQNDDIKLIVIGDNPGKNEQLSKNQRYLCGQSGKIAEGFFKRNSDLKIDFRKNVIILNKTPVHTAKTSHLRTLLKSQNPQIIDLITQSQIWMAKETAKLHQELFMANKGNTNKIQLWLVGYAELKGKGLFLPYRDAFFNEYNGKTDVWNEVLVFQHFSMNRFSIDLKNYASKIKTNELQNNILYNLKELGHQHSKEIFH